MTCNVLFEAYYQRYCEARAMPPAARADCFRTVAAAVFAARPIVMLQEVDLAWLPAGLFPHHDVYASCDHACAVATLVDRRYFALDTPAQLPSGAAAAVECHTLGRGGKAAVVVRVRDAEGVALTLVNAHVPFTMDAATQDRQFADILKPVAGDVDRTVIFCGDFNVGADKFHNNSFATLFPGWLDVTPTATVPWSARNARGMLDKIDYVLVRPAAAAAAAAALPWVTFAAGAKPDVLPADGGKLLWHTRNAPDVETFTYFSDHAAVAVTFGVSRAA
jgi:endonuclease/exonuclease/phosphatase family metal-dependent hydrolase